MAREIKKILKESFGKKTVRAQENKETVSDDMIAKKAYELYQQRGSFDGHAENDWLEAKRLLGAS